MMPNLIFTNKLCYPLSIANIIKGTYSCLDEQDKCRIDTNSVRSIFVIRSYSYSNANYKKKPNILKNTVIINNNQDVSINVIDNLGPKKIINIPSGTSYPFHNILCTDIWNSYPLIKSLITSSIFQKEPLYIVFSNDAAVYSAVAGDVLKIDHFPEPNLFFSLDTFMGGNEIIYKGESRSVIFQLDLSIVTNVDFKGFDVTLGLVYQYTDGTSGSLIIDATLDSDGNVVIQKLFPEPPIIFLLESPSTKLFLQYISGPKMSYFLTYLIVYG